MHPLNSSGLSKSKQSGRINISRDGLINDPIMSTTTTNAAVSSEEKRAGFSDRTMHQRHKLLLMIKFYSNQRAVYRLV